jgi:hypothetical protein
VLTSDTRPLRGQGYSLSSRHVFVFDPTDDASIPQGKQTKRLSHIFYTPCSGIWQSVWIETVPVNYISGLDVSADMTGNGISPLSSNISKIGDSDTPC